MVKRYLTLVSLETARETLQKSFDLKLRRESVRLTNSVDRVTAEPILSRYSVPGIHVAAMDGIAVRSVDTIGAAEQNPITVPTAVKVNTGAIIPQGYDAVVMIEEVWEGDRGYTIRKPVSPWQHVRPVGEDIGESEMILPSNHRIRAHEVGALAAYGITDVIVSTLQVGLIPTGSELVPHGTPPKPGQVIESNTMLVAAFLERMGVHCKRYQITPDHPDSIKRALAAAIAENDMVIISAGSSAGTRDFTDPVISELGEVLIHGVAMKPGKPVILGRIDGKPVIGLPGYPLSALTVLREIIVPFLSGMGFPSDDYGAIDATLVTTLHSEIGVDEFVFLSLGSIGKRWVAIPQSRGAGVQMSGVRANAYLRIPAASEGVEAGKQIDARLLVPRTLAEKALLITGSHDLALDYLADLIQRRSLELHSTHLGSMGGLFALKKRECHGATMHLLAPDGSYNVPYLQKYLPTDELALLCIAERQQGIVSTKDITFSEIPHYRFVNRQKGSGTRMLFDHYLQQRGIDPASIHGYERELTTHLAVALAVKTGEADAGICIYSAAKALGLSFVPLATERYELVVHKELLDDKRIQQLFECVESDKFTTILQNLGGYDTRETGECRFLP